MSLCSCFKILENQCGSIINLRLEGMAQEREKPNARYVRVIFITTSYRESIEPKLRQLRISLVDTHENVLSHE
jgi:hypothetical protein